jgi:hypothetical protein
MREKTTHHNTPRRERRNWEPMKLRHVGHVGDVLRGGGGKISLVGGDSGDARKQRGGGG